MDNKDYLEYEGSRLLAYVLQTFRPHSSGDLPCDMEKALPADMNSPSSQEQIQDFFWEYVLFRLYIASCMIRGFHDGFGSRTAILQGLETMLEDIPSYLKAIAMERDLSGSYLLIVHRTASFNQSYVKKQFAIYEAIESHYASCSAKEEGRQLSIAASLTHIADTLSFSLPQPLLLLLEEETLSYMSALSQRLVQMTPEGIRQRAHGKTLVHSHGSTFCQETLDHLSPSFTILAGMLAGMLVMFA